MKELLPLFTVFISGLFGLLVAFTTWHLANRKDKQKALAEKRVKHYDRMEDFYIRLIANLDKSVRLTMYDENYHTLHDDVSLLTAEAALLADGEVNEKLNDIGQILSSWVIEYKKGQPKRVGDTSYALVSNRDFPHQKKADELYTEFREEMGKFIELLQNKLDAIR